MLTAWNPPAWLLPHQRDGAQRAAAIARTFGGVLLADAVGLGKTYVALALATRYARPVAVVPASLVEQWRRVAAQTDIAIPIVSHESLSRGRDVPESDLVIVDEAHRFRHPATRRYDRLSRGVSGAHLLLVTATVVVNRPADLAHLLRLFLADHALAAWGVASLERAAERHRHGELAHAASVVTVARSPNVIAPQLPTTRDEPVVRASTLPPDVAPRVLHRLDALRFPSFADRRATALLRAHLIHRLASSAAAARETARRHLAYLDRAHAAALGGEPLSRGAARGLFGPNDELQLELAVWTTAAPVALEARAIAAERRRVLDLLDALPEGTGANPKADALAELLRARRDRKTIVFTTALATAHDLARRLGWHQVAVVGGGRAWIASGPVPVDAALSLFAPRARGTAPPGDVARVAILIATDLVSEGLDLQDADGVVHYDLPWTPLRLAQRLGRVVRLGSAHGTARVWWFAPPPALDRRLRLTGRLGAKTQVQLDTLVPATSAPGRARVLSRALDARERLAAGVDDGSVRGTSVAARAFAVVRAPACGAFALRWVTTAGEVPQLLVLDGDPPAPVADHARALGVLTALLGSAASPAAPSKALMAALTATVRDRLTAGRWGPSDGDTRRLARRLLRHARRCAARRDVARLRQLDAALGRLHGGLRTGNARALDDIVRGPRPGNLERWLTHCPPAPPSALRVTLQAAVLGDGSTPRRL